MSNKKICYWNVRQDYWNTQKYIEHTEITSLEDAYADVLAFPHYQYTIVVDGEQSKIIDLESDAREWHEESERGEIAYRRAATLSMSQVL